MSALYNKRIAFGRQALNKSSYHCGGFSSLELLIVISLTIFLAAAAIPIYGNFYGSSQLNERAAEIVQTIRTARERSVARLNDQPHGVYFYINLSGPDQFILYQGTSFNEVGRDTSYDRTIALEDSLFLTTTLVGDEVNFSRGLGTPSAIGEITLTNAIGKSAVISINSLGLVSD